MATQGSGKQNKIKQITQLTLQLCGAADDTQEGLGREKNLLMDITHKIGKVLGGFFKNILLYRQTHTHTQSILLQICLMTKMVQSKLHLYSYNIFIPITITMLCTCLPTHLCAHHRHLYPSKSAQPHFPPPTPNSPPVSPYFHLFL